MSTMDNFISGLTRDADVVVDLVDEGVVSHRGPLSLPEALSVRDWFDRRQAARRAKQS